jgi:hypothetical protein
MIAADQFLTRAPQAIKVFAGHATVAGAISSTGQPQIGQDIELDATALARLPADVHVAMNHIHKHQTVGRAVYAGSICRMDFGELEPKGLIDIGFELSIDATFDAPAAPTVDRVTWTFVPLDVPAMIHVEGRLTAAAGFEYTIAQASAPITPGDPAAFKGADVRVRYTYLRAEAAILNVALIHAEFAEARSLKIEAVPQHEHELRAPEVIAATTLVDKLRAYAESQGLPWSDALAEKAAAFETLPTDAWRTAALAAVADIGKGIV